MAGDDLDVLCVGETMVMVTPQQSVPLETAESVVLRAGGAESNVAMFLSELGHRVGWASRVGDEPLGRVVVTAVASTGVDTSLVEVASGERTGVYFKDPGPERTAVYYYRQSSAASRMSGEFVARLRDRRVTVLHVSGITPALSTTCADLVDEVVVRRALRPATVSFDVNYRAGLWALEQAAPVLLRLAEHADIVFVGLDEAAALWGTTSADDVRRMLASPQFLVVKDAERGATAFAPDGTHTVPALKVDVVEPVGAGDAFAAGWLSGWLRRVPAVGRLRLGHLLAGVAMSSTSDHGVVPGADGLAACLELDDHEWAAFTPAAGTPAGG